MKKIIKNAIIISFAVYILCLVCILFIRNGRGVYDKDLSIVQYVYYNLQYNINIVPFRTIISYIKMLIDGSVNANIPIENLLGNIAIFFPMAIYLPCFFKTCRSWLTIVWKIFVMLIAVEIVQWITGLGSFDVDDLILNMAGFCLGFFIWKSRIGQKIYTWIYE